MVSPRLLVREASWKDGLPYEQSPESGELDITMEPGMSASAKYSPSGLIESVPAIFYVSEFGEFGRWIFVSPQIEQILGYSPEEWIEDPHVWSECLHPDDREAALAFEDEALTDLDRPLPAQYRLRRKDGRYIWVADRARLVDAGQGKLVWRGMIAAIGEDVGNQVGPDRDAEQWKLLAHLGRRASKGEDTDELLREVVEGVAGTFNIDSAAVWALSDFGLPQPVCQSGEGPPDPSIDFDPESVPGTKLAKGEPVLIYDWCDPELEPFAPSVPDSVRSSVIAPIVGSPKHFGLLIAHSHETNAFGEHDLRFVESVANLLANAIDRRWNEEHLKHRLLNDPLTNLPNRDLFRNLLSEAITAAAESDGRIGVLFIGIDHLRLINDGLGHSIGDQLLREVGPKLSASMRGSDTVARFSDEEFAVILRGIESSEQAGKIAERIIRQISGPIEIDGVSQFVTASVGVTTCQPHGGKARSADDLIREANAAMHQAKESPRVRIQTYGHRIREKLTQRLKLERDLYRAVNEREFTLLYQPIIDLASGELASFESLVRWEHPDEGLLGPAQFTGIAEETGLIQEIDDWVLGEATRQTGIWLRELGDAVPVAVNVSCGHFARPELPGDVGSYLTQNGLPPGMLAIEMTESILLEPTHAVINNMNELRDFGVQMALDDFGTGFSSLSYLSEFPFDIIKIDRSFVSGLGDIGRRNHALVDAIVRIGKTLSLEIVAEGVSSLAQLQEVRRMGCQMAQGFLISRPLPAEGAAEFILRGEPMDFA